MKVIVDKKFKTNKEAQKYAEELRKKIGSNDVIIEGINVLDNKSSMQIDAKYSEEGTFECKIEAAATVEHTCYMMAAIMHQVILKVCDGKKEMSLDLLKALTTEIAEKIKNEQ